MPVANIFLQHRMSCMKHFSIRGLLLLTLFAVSPAIAQDVFITVDQFGYRPDAKKVAHIRGL